MLLNDFHHLPCAFDSVMAMPFADFSGAPGPHQDRDSRADNNNRYSLAASVEPSGACTALHLWAMAGAGKTWKRGEGRAEAEQEGIYSI
jgi:hypothetical protein